MAEFVALSLLLALIGAAHGGAFLIPDAGARALGRGGAYTAGVADLSAQYWNPAGLAPIDAPTVEIEFGGLFQLVKFDRADEEDLSFPAVRNQGDPVPIPRFAFAPVLPWKDIHVAIGVFTPLGAWYRYPSDGPQRYALVSSRISQINSGLTVALEHGPVAVGAGCAWSVLHAEYEIAATTSLDATDDPAYDIETSVSASDPGSLAANAGARIELTDHLVLGASATLPVRYDARGKLTADFSKNAFYTGESDLGQVIAVPEATDTSITMPMTLPWIVRGGIAGTVGKTEIEVDAVWEGWKAVSAPTITDIDLSIDTTGGEPLVVNEDITVPVHFRNGWSIRAGLEQDLGSTSLRGGLFYESPAVPVGSRSAAFTDGPKVGYGLGATLHAKKALEWTIGWSQSQTLAPEIERSSVFQVHIDPVTGSVGYGKTVGNGFLRATNTVLLGQVRFSGGV